MERLIHVLRAAFRRIRREPGFSTAVILTLALCIGANTAVFSAIYSVLLSPLEFEDPDRVAVVYVSYPRAGVPAVGVSVPEYYYWRTEIDAFEEVAVYGYGRITVGFADGPDRVQTLLMSHSMLPLMGMEPALGRNFTEEESNPEQSQRVMLTWQFWQDRYGGDPDVLGRELRLDSRPYTIVGVLPQDFNLLHVWDFEIALPIVIDPQYRDIRYLRTGSMRMFARLSPGATPEDAREQIRVLNDRLMEEYPAEASRMRLEESGYTTVVITAPAILRREFGPLLLWIWGGVILVLLLGCVNLANLLAARASGRMQELGIRKALGADHWTLAREQLAGTLVLSLIGAAAGLLVARTLFPLITSLGLSEMPRGDAVGLQLPVLLFTLGAAVTAALIMGILPLGVVLRGSLVSMFRYEDRTHTASRATVLLRQGLVAAQVALAFIVLCGAGLALVSYRNVAGVDPGFNPENVLYGEVVLPSLRYPDEDSWRMFADRALAEMAVLPGVKSAALTTQVPFTTSSAHYPVQPEGMLPPVGEAFASGRQAVVSPGHFETLGIPLIAGRGILESDDPKGDRVVIIDQILAQRYWPDSSPLEKRVFIGIPGQGVTEDKIYRIVGVAGEVRQEALSEDRTEGSYYLPLKQNPQRALVLLLRTVVPPEQLTEPLRKKLLELDPELPMAVSGTLLDRIDRSLLGNRIPVILLSAYSILALVLAAVGLYGVLAYVVYQRRREIGIRITVGCSAEGVFALFLRHGLAALGIGLVLGYVGTLILAPVARSQLYEVTTSDPLVMVGVAAVLAVVTVLASLRPSWKAARVDPVSTLNYE